jgi:hypothetical protein
MADGSQKKTNPLAAIGGVVGAIVGFVVARYAAMNLLVPGLTAVVVAVILAKTVPPSRKSIVGAFAVQVGQVVWFALGAILIGTWAPVALDVILLVVALAWLIARPSLVPLLICIIYQAIGLILNSMAFAQAESGTPAHQALVAHLLVRAVAIALLIAAIFALRRKRVEAAASVQGFPVVPIPPADQVQANTIDRPSVR